MKKKLNIFKENHLKTKRNYLGRINNKKVECMIEAKKYQKKYWDGNRKYGYGGYKFIPGRWEKAANTIIEKFKLNKNSKILDIGCGKGYLLYEIKKIIPEIKVFGLEISRYAIKNSHPDIKRFIKIGDIRKKLPYKKNEFDLLITLGCLHNLEINKVFFAIKEINRVSKKQFLLVESYRNEKELFNLQCWALTCNSFFSKNEWEWIFKKNNYKGNYEFIYFT